MMVTGKEIVSELDERIFGKNTLSTKLFKYFLTMALLMLALPVVLDIIFEILGIKKIFYYISLPSLVLILLIFFMIYSIKELLRPINELLEQVRKLQEGKLDVNLDIGGYVEIDSLVKSVNRMRNSLFIARSFLGERDSTRDSIWKKEISHIGMYLIFLTPFLIYGITLTIVGTVLYSGALGTVVQGIVPMWEFVRAVLVIVFGVAMAFSFGYILSKAIGMPMRKLAKAAEEASRGNMDADFATKERLGDIHELSVRLHDLKEAIRRAMEEMEGSR